MITLQELFDNLAYGEFANIALGNSPIGEIAAQDIVKMAAHTQMGLNKLHERFNLRKGSFTLYLQEGIEVYSLTSDKVVTDTANITSTKYIYTPPELPFADDLIKIIDIKDADDVNYRLNDPTALNPIFTPNYDTIKTVPADPPQVLSITYQAKYPKLVVDATTDPTTVNLDIPDFIIEPLLFYIAARVFTGLNSSGGEGSPAPSSTFLSRYELSCKQIEQFGLTNKNDYDRGDTFTSNGWV